MQIYEGIYKEIFIIDAILILALIAYKIIIKIWFMVYYEKEDNKTFEKRWDDCD